MKYTAKNFLRAVLAVGKQTIGREKFAEKYPSMLDAKCSYGPRYHRDRFS